MRRKTSDSTRTSTSNSSYTSPSSSSSSSSSTSPPESNDSPTDEKQQSTVAPATRQPLSRRGHFKSRLGCFNCKRRRVKCNELRPSCSPCRRLGLSCVYPTAAPVSSSGPVRANPSILALEDLRFYHQFMTRSFPTLPLRADSVWEQCAAMSHQFECLAHAVLALGASHLSQHGNVDYTPQALHHRVAAIKLVNEQLTNPPEGAAGADALFGAVVCLATQTSLLSDGMCEYLTMTRGGSLIALNIMTDMDKSVFGMFTNEGHIEALSAIVSPQQQDFTLAAGFMKSLQQLEPLCKESYEIVYYNALVQCIVGLENSAFQAWAEFAGLFRLHSFFSHEDFQVFVNPENYTCQLLIIHMFLLDYVLGQYCIAESEEFKFPARRWVIISWARDLVKRLPRDHKKYGLWISSYCDVLSEGDGRYLLTP